MVSIDACQEGILSIFFFCGTVLNWVSSWAINDDEKCPKLLPSPLLVLSSSPRNSVLLSDVPLSDDRLIIKINRFLIWAHHQKLMISFDDLLTPSRPPACLGLGHGIPTAATPRHSSLNQPTTSPQWRWSSRGQEGGEGVQNNKAAADQPKMKKNVYNDNVVQRNIASLTIT